MSLLSLLHGTTGKSSRTFTAVKLGPVYLTGTEVPPGIPFAGRQNVAVHDLYGGGRNVQSLGAADDPIEWSAMFVGRNAMKRARYLNTFRLSGKPIVLSFSGVLVTCVIEEFKPVYKAINWVPYTIRLIPQTESWNNPVVTTTQTHASFLQGLVADANNVRAWWSAAMTTAMNDLQTVMNGISDLASVPAAVISGLTTTVSAVQSEIAGIQASVENTLLNITTLGGVFPNNPLASAVSSLSNQLNAVTTQYQVQNLNGLMSITDNTLANVGASVEPFLPLVTPEVVSVTPLSGPVTEIVQAGTPLEEVALRYYGDATEWPVIATANGLTDPIVASTQRIIIPVAPATPSGGVLIPAGVDVTWQTCPV